jgi:hypothetical protein
VKSECRRLAGAAVAHQPLVLGDRRGQRPALGRVVLGEDRGLEVRLEDAQLARRRATDGGRARERIPRPAERQVGRAAAVAVRGEHRADAAAAVGVGAGDDGVRSDSGEHRLARAHRQTPDGALQGGDRVARPAHGAGCTPAAGVRQRLGGRLQ